jgi:hypothetical protein
MESGKQTERCGTKYSNGYSNLSTLNSIPAPPVGMTKFSVQMGTSGIGNRFYQQDMHIARSIATNIISRGMSIFDESVQRRHLEIMSHQQSNTPGGFITTIECSAMPSPRLSMLYSRRTLFIEEST